MRNHHLPFLACAVALCWTANSLAQDPWQTVDDFQLATGLSSYGYAIGKDPTGTVLFSVGTSTNPQGNSEAIVNRSVDAGASWQTTYHGPVLPGATDATFCAFAADASGRLYAGGFAIDAVGSHWVISASEDGGINWTTIDDFQIQAGLGALCVGLAVDVSSGDVYAAGWAQSTSTLELWAVRKLEASTHHWRTVDTVSPSPSGHFQWSHAQAVAVYPTAGIFVAGFNMNRQGLQVWTVRRSSDHGVTWTTVDSGAPGSVARGLARDTSSGAYSGAIYAVGFTAGSKGQQNWGVRMSRNNGTTWNTVDTITYGMYAAPWCVNTDQNGNLYVGGSSGSPSYHWLIRKSLPGGQSWQLSDDYALQTGKVAVPHDIAIDTSGNVFVTGEATDRAGISHWITRGLMH